VLAVCLYNFAIMLQGAAQKWMCKQVNVCTTPAMPHCKSLISEQLLHSTTWRRTGDERDHLPKIKYEYALL
jgi:hypothetical protein